MNTFSTEVVPRLEIYQTYEFSKHCSMVRLAENRYRGDVVNCVGGVISSRFATKRECIAWICEKNNSIEQVGRI